MYPLSYKKFLIGVIPFFLKKMYYWRFFCLFIPIATISAYLSHIIQTTLETQKIYNSYPLFFSKKALFSCIKTGITCNGIFPENTLFAYYIFSLLSIPFLISLCILILWAYTKLIIIATRTINEEPLPIEKEYSVATITLKITLAMLLYTIINSFLFIFNSIFIIFYHFYYYAILDKNSSIIQGFTESRKLSYAHFLFNCIMTYGYELPIQIFYFLLYLWCFNHNIMIIAAITKALLTAASILYYGYLYQFLQQHVLEKQNIHSTEKIYAHQ